MGYVGGGCTFSEKLWARWIWRGQGLYFVEQVDRPHSTTAPSTVAYQEITISTEENADGENDAPPQF